MKVLNRPNILFGSRKGPDSAPFIVRRLNARTSLTNKIVRAIVRRLAALKEEGSSKELRAYDAGYLADDDEPRFVEIADDPVIKAVHDSIPQSTAGIGFFEKADRGNGRLSYYCLQAFDERGREVRFYQKMNPVYQLKRRTTIEALDVDGQYVAADDHPLLFDPDFNCATFQGMAFIFGTGGFETLFHYYEELKTYAAETLDEINSDHVVIEDFDNFKVEVLESRRNIKRLRSIASRGHLKNYTFDGIKRTIAEYGLHIKVEQDKGKPVLIWKDGEEDEVLKLLDDYYLVSTTSNLHYGSNSKEILARPR